MNRSAEKPAGWVEPDLVRPLAPGEFYQIRRLAHQVSGLDLKSGKEELVTARLRNLVHHGGFRSFQDYYRHVVNDNTGQLLANMIDALVTNHTAFYREPDHFEFLRQQLVPVLAQRDTVEVWSAACATGEEVWTLAFVLNDAMAGKRIHITGTDISNKARRFAEKALYPADRCLGMPAGWLSRYFTAEGDSPKSYRVIPRIRAQAEFHRANLIAPARVARRYPVIFCRNVMIYFDSATQEKVVGHLSDHLEPGGHLFVGHAESLTRISHSLQYVRPAVYRRPVAGEAKWSRS